MSQLDHDQHHHHPDGRSSVASTPPRSMDSSFQDSPTIGRTQVLTHGYSSNSPSSSPLSAANPRYDSALVVYCFLFFESLACVLSLFGCCVVSFTSFLSSCAHWLSLMPRLGWGPACFWSSLHFLCSGIFLSTDWVCSSHVASRR